MKKTTPILLTIIAILFVSVLYLLFLNSNNSNFSNIISNQKISPTITSTDENFDWKTYVRNKCGDWPESQTVNFTYKIPSEMIETISNKASCCTSYTYSSTDLSITFTCGDGFGGMCDPETPTIQNVFKTADSTISGCLKKSSDKITLHNTYAMLNSDDKFDHPGISITAQGIDSVKNRQLINQIISTFKFIDLNNSISSSDLAQGWYWAFENQRKTNTPENWVFKEAGRSSCWHAPNQKCDFNSSP